MMDNLSKILIVYSARIPTVSLISGLMKNFEKKGFCKIEERPVVEIAKSDLEWADTLLCIRPFEIGAYRVVAAAKRAEKKIVIYLDDDLLHLPDIYANNLRRFLSRLCYKQNCNYLIKCLGLCDVLWGSNEMLVDKYAKFLGRGRCVITDVALEFSTLADIHPSDKDFRILFTGSGDHAEYINRLVIPALNNLNKHYHNIVFSCVGIDPSYLDECDVNTEYIPWIRDFDEFNNFIISRHFDVGVAPIMKDDFHRCKYFNKFIEYSRYGLAGIYTNDYPYRLIVNNNYNGLLADNTVEDWQNKLAYMLDNPDECVKMAKNARRLCKERFSEEIMIDAIEENLPEFTEFKSNNKRVHYYPSVTLNILRKYLTSFVEKYEYKKSMKNIEKNETHVLMVYAGYTTTTELLKNILESVKEKNRIKLLVKESSVVTAKDIKAADTVLFSRGADPYMAKISEAAKKANRSTILYLDDDLYGIYKDTVYGDALLKCLENCDILWASNPAILEKYGQMVSHIRKIEEKVFDPIEQIDPLCNVKDEVTILYAGSPAHRELVQDIIVPALNLAYDKFKNFRVVFMGIKDGSLTNCNFKREYIPWSNSLEEYRNTIKNIGCHIGLGIIRDDNFGNCKYFNKFLEYSRMGIAGIYSDVVPYRMVVDNFKNGILVKNNPEQWRDAILSYINDEQLRKDVVINSQRTLSEEFRVEDVVDRLIVKIPELVDYHAPNTKVTYITNRFLHHLNYIWREYIVSRFIGGM